jgi:hypothetical protein
MPSFLHSIKLQLIYFVAVDIKYKMFGPNTKMARGQKNTGWHGGRKILCCGIWTDKVQ